MAVAFYCCEWISPFVGGLKKVDKMRMVKRTKLFGSGILLAVLMVGVGCGTESTLTDPGNPLQEAASSILLDDDDEGLKATWYEVAAEEVYAYEAGTVTGSRYTLTLDDKALDRSVVITIGERDPDVIDVELGPDGTVFKSLVTLTIDYRGTKNDPSTKFYNGRKAMLFYYNSVAGMWDEVPGTDDPQTRTFTAELEHFSRYAMWDGASSSPDGTSGWELASDPHRKSVKN